MSKIRQNKGITLVALVITIILIVLLSAITISSLTGSGLFEQAKEAKRRQEIAEMEEKLNLAVTQTTLEKNRNITIDDYINTLIKNGIIGEGDTEDIENGKIITTEGGLLFEVTTDEAGEIEIEYVGTTETMIPTISLNVIGSTTNTIKVSTISRRNKEGTIEYYIKKENDNYSKEPSYKETNIENGKTYTYEFENLDQEQKYIIKAVAVGTNGKKEEEEKEWTTGVIPELIAKDISFSYEPDNWTNGPVKVTADIVNEEVVTTGFTLRLTNDITTDATTWPTATEGLTVSTNGEIYALLVDGRGQIGKSNATGNVEKIDTQIPVANITNTTTNSITFTGTDTAKTGESASGIAGYMIKENSTKPNATDTGWKSYDGTSKTVNGLTQGRTYHLFVKDNAENVSEVASRGTDTVTNLIPTNVTFAYEPNGWTNGSVTVTATLNIEINSNYTLKITDSNPIDASKQTALGWADASTGITVSTNQDVYAVLVDNEGQIGDAAGGNVDKIDTQIPVVNITNATTNSITFTGTDTAKTGESASGIAGYMIKENSTKPNATDSGWESYDGTSKTVNGLTQGRTYHLFVKDNAENVSEVASEGTGTVTSGLITGAITFSKATWSGGKATVTISTNTNYTIQYQKNSVTGTWITGTNVTNLTHNDIVYARLIDTTGQTGDTGTDTNNYASTNIVDGVNPTIGSAKGSTTTGNTGTVTVSNIADTGGSGLKGIYISQNSTKPTATSVKWTSNTNSQYSISVSSNGTYNVWVLDNAGNVSEVKSCSVSGIVSKVSISSYSGGTVVAGNTIATNVSYSGTAKNISYSSSNTGVATINSSGVVTGIKAGNATMTVTMTNYDNTSVTKTCTITVQQAIAQIGTTNYSSLGNAVASVTNSTAKTIKLLSNTTEDIRIVSGRNITLNLNGKTLSSKETNKGTIINEGTVTIYGGTIVGEPSAIFTRPNSVTNITGGTYISNTDTAINAYRGTINITDGTFTGKLKAIWLNGADINVTINGGTFNATEWEPVQVQAGTINITNGTFTGKNHGLWMDAGTATISGGTFNGIYGMSVSGTAKLNVNGGTFVGENYGLRVENISLTIYGGSFTGKNYDGAIVVIGGILNIRGGTFTGKNYGAFQDTGGTLNIYAGTLKGNLGQYYK